MDCGCSGCPQELLDVDGGCCCAVFASGPGSRHLAKKPEELKIETFEIVEAGEKKLLKVEDQVRPEDQMLEWSRTRDESRICFSNIDCSRSDSMFLLS